MSGEVNKALVRRFVEAHPKGDLDALRELLAPDFVDHRPILVREPGREGYIRAVAERNAAFSDIHFDIEDQMAAEGNRVAALDAPALRPRTRSRASVRTRKARLPF